MGPQGFTADRIADLELQVAQLQRYTATQQRAQAPLSGLVIRNAISALPPDAEPGDDFVATDRPWVVFVNPGDGVDPETTRREKPVHRAQTRDGSFIVEAGKKLVVYYHAGRWWIVPPEGLELIYLGDPASSDPYVEPVTPEDAYDARLYTLANDLGGEVTETKVWLFVGQRYDEHATVTPMPRGLVLLAKQVGMLEVGDPVDERPAYYANHWQWLWVKLGGAAGTKLLDKDTERDSNALLLDKDGTETAVEITVHNHTGTAIPGDARVFVFYHQESGQWWILQPPAGTIVRAKVLTATITTSGDVNLFDETTGTWSATATEITNRGRPLFADEEITVGLNRAGEWVPLEVPNHLFDGTADAAIAKGAAGNVILDHATNPTIVATSRLGAVANGDIVIVAWIGTGWQIIASETRIVRVQKDMVVGADGHSWDKTYETIQVTGAGIGPDLETIAGEDCE